MDYESSLIPKLLAGCQHSDPLVRRQVLQLLHTMAASPWIGCEMNVGRRYKTKRTTFSTRQMK